MRRAEEILYILVVVRMLVLGPYHETNGTAGGFSIEDAWKEFHCVRFLSAGGKERLSGAAAIQLLLHKIHIDVDTCRKTVNYTTDTGTVRLAETR